MTDRDAGALLLVVRRDQANLTHGEAFGRYRSIGTV
jgi:hypothetical protein